MATPDGKKPKEEEGTGKEIGGRRNANATMDVWSYEAGQENKLINRGGYNACGGHRNERPGKEVEVVWACDEKRGALRRKEGDGNESTREKDMRKT